MKDIFMKTTLCKILSILALATGFTVGANAVVMDFQAIKASGTGSPFHYGTTYVEDGFSLTALPGTNSLLYRARTGDSNFYAGSTALFNSGIGATTELVESSGIAFSLISIDLSELTRTSLEPTSVEFIGNLLGGGTVLNQFSLDGAFGLETFSFSGFEAVTSVRWIQSAGYHQFDNIVLGPASGSGSSLSIPDQGSTAVLAGLGFIFLAVMRVGGKVSRIRA